MLETEQMFKKAGEKWPVVIPEEELSQSFPGTKLHYAVQEKASAMKPARDERDTGPLLPFEELLNFASINAFSEQKEDCKTNGLENCSLPDPHALLHVTSRKKPPLRKVFSQKENHELVEMQEEYEDLLQKFETQCTTPGKSNLLMTKSEAILVIKQLQEKIRILETEKSSSLQNLDSVVELATEQNIYAREKYEKFYNSLDELGQSSGTLNVVALFEFTYQCNSLSFRVSNSTISGTLTLNDVVSSVMNDEMRRKTIGDGISSSTALSVKSRGRQNNKQNNRGRSPTRGRSKSRGKSKSKGRTIVCWNCNKEGHKKNDCAIPKKKNGAGGRQGDEEGENMVSSNERTYDDLCLSAIVDDNSKVWYVDSGALIHCIPHRDCFSDYVHGDYGHVTVGLGHLSESGMRILHSKNPLQGMENIQLDFCEGCVYGKEKRVSFRKDGKERKTDRLELVHTDVCGPTTIKSLGSNFYFVSFIDDAGRKIWIYAIKQEYDVYHTFKK
ncbi:hypothetical protein RJ640_003477 [Escallonia rubra]|uniref:CCHC-type domain-containing protein n=1 Tax=Escallonia rubra TaxID=112253 RepID=A0AA88QGC3_9ASTE|nr:hypothetical protein RJ640_003477 [Escallonia rubra]